MFSGTIFHYKTESGYYSVF